MVRSNVITAVMFVILMASMVALKAATDVIIITAVMVLFVWLATLDGVMRRKEK